MVERRLEAFRTEMPLQHLSDFAGRHEYRACLRRAAQDPASSSSSTALSPGRRSCIEGDVDGGAPSKEHDVGTIAPTPRYTRASGIPRKRYHMMRVCISCPAVAVKAKTGGEPNASRITLSRPYSGSVPLPIDQARWASSITRKRRAGYCINEQLLLVGISYKEALGRHIEQLGQIARQQTVLAGVSV